MSDPSIWTGLPDVLRAFDSFANRCVAGQQAYRLTPAADDSPYARCFWIYCRHLCRHEMSPDDRTQLAEAIRSSVRQTRTLHAARPSGKAFRQLLAFSLSALSALDAFDGDRLADLVEEQLPSDVQAELDAYGCLQGRPGSGNQAMFSAVFLLYARDYLGHSTQRKIDEWVGLHLNRMNRFGFWGPDGGATHLQFQNGYHQYEILEYVGASNPRSEAAMAMVQTLADPLGHFGPYPGGGGCYDYDAVFVLTANGRAPGGSAARLLETTATTLMREQGADGGFAESLYVRPRSLDNARRFAAHIVSSASRPRLFGERLRYGMTLQRPAHDRIHTHWSAYSRRWDESDLWDSWFRLLTLARIQVALDPAKAADWGFLSFPGIGYHPSAPERTPA